MTYLYTKAEYDAFGWSPLSGSSYDPAETYGLDYESAREVTPRWYGVSFGNGNDGVSHTFPNYYVRTADPYTLAAAAVIASFKDGFKQAAADACEVDGEADYTISATIYNPEDVEPKEPDYESIATANGFNVVEHVDSTFVYVKLGELGDSDSYDSEDAAWKACCEEEDLLPDPEDEGSYSDANGAWLICEVFPVDEMPGCLLLGDNGTVEHVQYNPYGNPAYCTLADAFEPEDLRLAAE
jgi:hypothetical protein